MSNPFFGPWSVVRGLLYVFKITTIFSYTSGLTGLAVASVEPVMSVIWPNWLNYGMLLPLPYGLCELILQREAKWDRLAC
jgi:hypothetical protein